MTCFELNIWYAGQFTLLKGQGDYQGQSSRAQAYQFCCQRNHKKYKKYTVNVLSVVFFLIENVFSVEI